MVALDPPIRCCWLWGLLLGLAIPYVWVLDGEVRERFGQLQWQVPTTVYAQPLQLATGQRMDAATLQLELDSAQYRNDGVGSDPGAYAHDGDLFRISTRGFIDLKGPEPASKIEVQLGGGRVVSMRIQGGAALNSAELDPARIAALYGSNQEERQLVRAG